MKKIRTIDHPNPGRRRAGVAAVTWPAMAGYCLMSAILLLSGCSKDEADGGTDLDPVAVEFRAAVASATRTANGGGASRHPGHYHDTEIAGVSMHTEPRSGDPATRTDNGGDDWTDGDKVGMFMVDAGGTLPGGILTVGGTSADNREYKVNPATEALTPQDNGPLYYPQSGSVDFIAYYPYTGSTGINPGEITTDYKYNLTVAGQETGDQNKLDVLYAKTENVAKSKTVPVNLTFEHVLSKVTLNVTAGDGIEAADIMTMTAADVVFKGMPLTAQMDLRDGSLTAGTDLTQTFTPVKGTATGSTHATFTALIVPQPQDNGATSPGLPDLSGRTVVFTVAGKPMIWKIPDNMAFLKGKHYSIPITVKLTGVEVGTMTIENWNRNTNTNGDGEARQIMPEANSYMVAPGSEPILIPVSQANRVLTADGLGAATDGLHRVKAGDFTVELVWGDRPIGMGEVIEAAVPDDDCIKVTPGDTPGNAVIGIKLNGETEFRWSWHIWVTDPVTARTDTKTGLTWMDRNLGATANTPLENGTFNNTQWVKTLGLYYQWGRKDAFPGSNGTDNTQQYYTESGGPTNANHTGSYTKLYDMVQNPLHVASNSSYRGSVDDSSANNNSWGGVSGEKTVYDPCPPGWRVPPATVNSVDTWGGFDNPGWLSFTDKGRLFNGVDGNAGLGHYYPAAGYRGGSNFYNTGSYGWYWSSSASNATSGWYLYFYQSYVNQNNTNRNYAFSVRCVQI